MSNKPNYSTLIISSLKDFQTTFPEMTFGEVLYSFLRQGVSGAQIPEGCLNPIRALSDEVIYEAIEKTIKIEQESPDEVTDELIEETTKTEQ